MINEQLFTGSKKLTDMVEANFNLLAILARMGMRFAFGDEAMDETAESACRRNGVDLPSFLLICNTYAFDFYSPTAEELRQADLRTIVDYLQKSHVYYMEIAMASLSDAIDRMLEPCGERHRKIINGFFRDYKDELAKHFEYEENVVFPYVESIIAEKGGSWHAVDEYEGKHTNVEEKIDDLKSIVMKYMPPECDSQHINYALLQLFALGKDLEKHIAIEDEILVPMVNGQDAPKRKVFRQEAEELSVREKEILVCVAKGMLNKEIADLFSLSIHTVITHRKNITRKTGIKTVAGLTVYALLNNLIDINSFE